MTLAPVFLFLAVFLVLILGYPVALSLAGTALIAAGIGVLTGTFDPAFLHAMPNRLFGIVSNQTLIAVPLFVLMGVTLEKTRIAEQLLDAMSRAFGRFPGGLGLSVTIVGMLMAASTGIVGATVVTMGLMSLPAMLKARYNVPLATGTICATGTLGQIIPPSIALVLLGDVLSNAYQQAQLSMGIFNPKTVSVGDLFAGAIIPGLVLVVMYTSYIVMTAVLNPEKAPPVDAEKITAGEILSSIFPPLLLIIAVLGSILGGLATPTEAAGVGAMGALLLALFRRELGLEQLREIAVSTTKTTAMVFFILIGASVFALVFRGYGGDELVTEWFEMLPGGVIGATFIVMLIIFLLGFILDFIEITFVVVPIVGPALMAMGVDPIWLGIMIAINLQTSFLTPPFGFALFYLRGVAPSEVTTGDVYRGVVPFIVIQLIMLVILAFLPELATWLPGILYS
ncbi:MAG: TRAP transporter large permease subunit [Pseudomonadales bacterium]|nr:TRAP transporter large permease subunit [Pseudomonadales bacterium]MBO6563646.1 TRAP transporter large permease subunit [Pseudomonadales bacterium]MBO6596660.1 TRAP transporter large permease subunit [Pseudomonadales bacterium]MBO6703331.1 TRAP transporter large permease subunit [Pseudomonadales bacterium]MBO6823351.1 TRAP transporter large permease subunit [Pseudomonadales bacterium]